MKFEENNKPINSRSKGLIIALSIIIVLLIGGNVYQYFDKDKPKINSNKDDKCEKQNECNTSKNNYFDIIDGENIPSTIKAQEAFETLIWQLIEGKKTVDFVAPGSFADTLDFKVTSVTYDGKNKDGDYIFGIDYVYKCEGNNDGICMHSGQLTDKKGEWWPASMIVYITDKSGNYEIKGIGSGFIMDSIVSY